jgi:hypothetical protein
VVTLHSRIATHHGYILRPQEFNLLLRSEEIKLMTSKMATVSVRIRCEISLSTGDKNDPIRCFIPMTGLCPTWRYWQRNIIMLPDDLFLNLINMNLQERITNCTNLDTAAIQALTLLLNQELDCGCRWGPVDGQAGIGGSQRDDKPCACW